MGGNAKPSSQSAIRWQVETKVFYFLLEVLIMTELKQKYAKRYILNQAGKEADQTLNLLVLNIMPNKLETEGQILNLSAGYSKNLSFTFLYPQSHHFKSDVLGHLKKTYATLDEIEDENFDALIVTGAPVETIDFHDVDYWEEFTKIVDWAKSHVKQTLYLCWSAQAALYYDYGIGKHAVNDKIFGIFEHHVETQDSLLEGLGDTFYLPHSRHSTNYSEDILQHPELTLLADNKKIGPAIIISKDHRNTFITGHLEYNTNTLANEYFRDLNVGKDIELPENYFYANDPSQRVINRWHETGLQIFSNWLDQI